jgi:2-oxoglutarate/2-oxoacid ferredoxin oxidoreductase subunit beta
MIENSISSYLDQDLLPYFFCPGCGHGLITDQINAALVKLQLDPKKVVIVTDIGCSGLTDKYFKTNAFHGLHGRSITYATGIKLANPDLKVIVLMGDGGCGIGGHHLINAARRNVGMTVVVFNNLNYGMTGGEHSVSTPPGGITSSTPLGQLERPMDICQTAAVNGASFVVRTTSFDKNLSELIAQAIQNEGFSLLDVWELCTAYYAPGNRLNKKALFDTMAALNFPTGILHHESRPEYSRAYREVYKDELGKPLFSPKEFRQQYQHSMDKEVRFLVAGAAGQKINTAAAAFCRGALMSGLWASQRNDYPVTVKSGHSVSEVILSPHPAGFTGDTKVDRVVVIFKEGLGAVGGSLKIMGPEGRVYINKDLLPIDTSAQQTDLYFVKEGSSLVKKEYWAVMALAHLLREEKFFPLDAFKEAAANNPAFAEANLAAIEASDRLSFGQTLQV